MRRLVYFRTMAEAHPFRTSLQRLNDAGALAAWEDLLAHSAQATAFSDLAFGAAIETAFGFPAWLAELWDGEALAAGALVFEKRVGPFRAAALPPFAQYVTPVLVAPLRDTDVHHDRSALGALADLLRTSFDQVNLALHPSLTDTRALHWAGWEVQPAYTYRLNLQGRTSTTEGWSGTTRRTYQNEAERYTVDEGSDHIGEALALVEASHTRQGHGLDVETATAEALMRSLAAAGLLRVFVARSPAAEAGLFVLSDGRTAHYWMAGSVPGAGMTALVGHILARLQEEGTAYFDFAGANVPSIAEFKRKFGGTLVPYARARCIAHPALRLADRLRPR